MLSPVVLFVYNRAEHTKKTIDALQKNTLAHQTDLYIYSDFPKNNEEIKKVQDVRDALNNLSGFNSVTVIKREKNFGLGKSVIKGVTEVLNKYDKVIVLEDDLVTHKDFLSYMNKMLMLHEHDRNVFSVSGYSLPGLQNIVNEDYVFVPRISSWGWGCWKSRWEELDWEIKSYRDLISNKKSRKDFNMAGDDMLDMLIHQVEGEAESWAIRFDYNRFMKGNLLTIYPRVSYIDNIGMDGSGVHGESTSKYGSLLEHTIYPDLNLIEKNSNFSINPLVISEFRKAYPRKLKSIFLIYLRRYGFYKSYKSMYKKIQRSFK